MPSEREPPSSNPSQNYRWKQQQSGERAKEPQFGELGGAVPENTARASAPSNSPSGTSNSPLLFSTRRNTDQAEEWILRGRGFAVNGIGGNSGRPCARVRPPPLWKPGAEGEEGGRHFICSSVLPPLLTPRGLQNRILSAQRRATPSR